MITPFGFIKTEAAAGEAYVTDSLVQYLDPFDSTIVGTDISDLSDNDITATGVNGISVTGTKGAGGNAGWVLDSTSTIKYIDCNNESYVGTISGWTHECFFRRTDNGSDQTSEPMLVSIDILGSAPYTNQRLLDLGIKNASESYIFFIQVRDDNATYGTYKSNVSSTADTDWHHLVATYDTSGGMKLYIDGALDTSGTTSGSPNSTITFSNTRPTLAGGPLGTSLRGFGSAYLGLVRNYSKALNASEVLQNYNANKADYGL